MKKFLTMAVLCVALCGCGSGTKVTLKEKIEAEYGVDLKVEDLTDQEGIKLKEVKGYDAKKIGEQTIKVIFTDANDKEIEQEVTLTVNDTKKPEITLNKDKVEITAGDKFDAKSNVKSVKDPVDGDLKYSDKKDLAKDGYQVTGSVDTKKAGNYKLKVVAYDKNGNKAEKEYTVTVKEKPKEESTSAASSGSTNNTTASSQRQAAGSSAPVQSGGSAQPAPQPSKTVCPNGNEPENPSLPCDAVLDWGYANPQIAFSSFEEACDWAEKQMDNPEYYKKYTGWSTASIWVNDGGDWYAIRFY